MLCIHNTSMDPIFNVAAEEYLLKDRGEDFFVLWCSRPSIIIGKHQNAYAEINFEFVRENDIEVVRRLSGGGAVFHDPGNINYTFIRSVPPGTGIDFVRYTTPILEVLQDLGVDAQLTGRSDLTIAGWKFSGNAQYIYRNRVLHHGTMLFSSEIKNLSAALQVNPDSYQDRAIQSNRSTVTNIQQHLSRQMGILEFIDLVMEYVVSCNPDTALYRLTAQDKQNIQRYSREKYATWEWNFGFSPPYSFARSSRFMNTPVEIHLKVRQGIIQTVRISGDFADHQTISDLEERLTGVSHRHDTILETMHKVPFFARLEADSLEGFIQLMF
ncbi:MAG: lipoate--protein ligase [Anaerolineales bacterium]|nr:lipoate--protein ligase [Anaerolineales bacterium]